MVGRGNEHSVEAQLAAVAEQLAEIGVDGRARHALGGRLAGRRVDIAQGDDAGAGTKEVAEVVGTAASAVARASGSGMTPSRQSKM